jgi:hypothetical protein
MPASFKKGFVAPSLIATLLASILSVALSARTSAPRAAELATFTADVSPPLGQRVCVGFIPAFTEIEHPLLAKGIVLRDAGGTYVLCAIDFEGLCNDSYDLFRSRLAEAAGTTPNRVAIQCLHQHTAPVFDSGADRLLYASNPEALESGLNAASEAADKIARAVRAATASWQPVTHVGTSRAKVERVASNRRVPLADGSLVARYSAAGGEAAMRNAPEGLIDPWVRTVSFYEGDRPLARLHYYATHPQSRSDGRVTYDVPGLARERLQRETGVFQVYFTGCGGNVAMGKYNDGTPAGRAELAQRLYEGLLASIAAEDPRERKPVTPIRWTTRAVQFPLRSDEPFTPATSRRTVADLNVPFAERLKAALLLTWIERVQSERPVELSCLAIGDVRLVHLPGEPFVQFQLAAQAALPDLFVAVAGYGECAMWYIGEDRIYTDRGGYEQSWSFVAPCEELMRTAIAELLSD